MSWFKKRRRPGLLGALGPGFVTGASDDDPSGIATYSQTGALFGYSQLWLAFVSLPFMTVIQEMCGRIGMVKGRGLAAVIRERHGRPLLFFAVAALLFANAINIGADLGAMASTMQMLLGGNFVVWLLMLTAGILFLEIFVSYRAYSRYLKFLALSLVTYVAAAFIVTLAFGLAQVAVIASTSPGSSQAPVAYASYKSAEGI